MQGVLPPAGVLEKPHSVSVGIVRGIVQGIFLERAIRGLVARNLLHKRFEGRLELFQPLVPRHHEIRKIPHATSDQVSSDLCEMLLFAARRLHLWCGIGKTEARGAKSKASGHTVSGGLSYILVLGLGPAVTGVLRDGLLLSIGSESLKHFAAQSGKSQIMAKSNVRVRRRDRFRRRRAWRGRGSCDRRGGPNTIPRARRGWPTAPAP
jgi:hypothetical protein